MIKEYYRLAKPGIVYGNVLTTLAAFLYASGWTFKWELLIATILGMALIIASACIFNNYFDRDIDAKMNRTKKRALVSGKISNTAALIYGAILLIFGVAFLFAFVNLLTTLFATIGFFFYVLIYTFSKRVTHWSTLIGSISGAMPIIAGYTAVADRLDTVSILLLIILAVWQMPHFYAIAIYRIRDYREAGIPVLPIVKGVKRTKIEIILYIIAFLIITCSLALFGFAGSVYLIMMFAVSFAWLILALQGFRQESDEQWARHVFFFSLIVILLFSIILALSPLLS
ncbi:MAG TPA: heme o synthase [Candidatus Paceibacterota bacterium]|nr:heme o synthase [Candidatus Paceibacterota bacterium]